MTAGLNNIAANFLDLSFYTGGFTIPPGDYALEFHVKNHRGEGNNPGPSRLGAMITMHSLTDPEHQGQKAFTKFYSFGSNADKTWAPNPATGKGIVSLPGAPAAALNNSTNWYIFLKSLYDSGLPGGMVSNDLSPLDGVWVHLENQDEPDERKSFQTTAKTGEVAAEEKPRTPQKIAVVTMILEGGRPWEGGGGIPGRTRNAYQGAAGQGPMGGVAQGPVPVMRPPVQPYVPSLPQPPIHTPAPSAGGVSDDVLTAAITGIAAIIENHPNGLPAVLLKTKCFGHLSNSPAFGPVLAKAAQDFLNIPANMDSLLSQFGYTVSGINVQLKA